MTRREFVAIVALTAFAAGLSIWLTALDRRPARPAPATAAPPAAVLRCIADHYADRFRAAAAAWGLR